MACCHSTWQWTRFSIVGKTCLETERGAATPLSQNADIVLARPLPWPQNGLRCGCGLSVGIEPESRSAHHHFGRTVHALRST
jgi:hypothetical protein